MIKKGRLSLLGVVLLSIASAGNIFWNGLGDMVTNFRYSLSKSEKIRSPMPMNSFVRPDRILLDKKIVASGRIEPALKLEELHSRIEDISLEDINGRGVSDLNQFQSSVLNLNDEASASSVKNIYGEITKEFRVKEVEEEGISALSAAQAKVKRYKSDFESSKSQIEAFFTVDGAGGAESKERLIANIKN